MLGFGSLGQFSLGENGPTLLITTVVQPAQGIGQAGIIRGAATVTFSGAVGIGVAGQIAPNIRPLQPQAEGIGVAGTISTNYQVGFTGAVGVGVAGSLSGETRPAQLTGVAGIGVARDLAIVIVDQPTSAVGVGVAGSLGPSVSGFTFTGAVGVGVARGFSSYNLFAFIQQASGIGVAHGIISQSSAPTVVPAIGIGVARWNPDGGNSAIIAVTLPQAAGVGVAGDIKPVLSGGGGNGPAAPSGERRRGKMGMEPVKKLPPRPAKRYEEPKIEPPPFRPRPPVQRPLPPELVSPLFDVGIPDLNEVLRGKARDEQDAEDIAAILEFLDQID